MAQKVEVELELKYKEAVKNLDEFQKEYAKLEKEVVSANEKTAKSLKQVEKSADDGAKGVKKVGVSLKSIGAATGVIFLLQKAFEFVSTAIQENQVVMDGLNVVFKTAQIIFNEVLGVITDVYNSVASASENFDALGKVISGLLTLAFAPLQIAFYGIIAAAEGVKLAYENMFGDEDSIAKAQEDLDATNEKLKEIAIEVNKAGSDIVNNFSEAISEAGNIGTQVVDGLKEISIEAAIETAKTNQALEKSAQIAAAESRILLEQYDRQAEIQRQIRDDETKSIAERQAANDELNVILDNQEKAMLKNAEIVLAAAQAQFNLTGKTEDYVCPFRVSEKAPKIHNHLWKKVINSLEQTELSSYLKVHVLRTIPRMNYSGKQFMHLLQAFRVPLSEGPRDPNEDIEAAIEGYGEARVEAFIMMFNLVSDRNLMCSTRIMYNKFRFTPKDVDLMWQRLGILNCVDLMHIDDPRCHVHDNRSMAEGG